MAYSKDVLVEKALSAIEEHECTTVEEVLLFLPISKRTFYNHELHEVNDIKEAIDKVKVKLKKGMKKNWHQSENATLQIAAYRLMATDAEFERLVMNKQTVDAKINELPKIILEYNGNSETGNQGIR